MSKQTIAYFTFLYISIPVLIFFFGWLHNTYASILSGLLVLGMGKYLRRSASEPDFAATTAGTSKSWPWVLIAGLAFGWVFFSGIGGFANQDWDHHFRNALFRDLIVEDWPVYYTFPPSYPDPGLANHQLALNYYLTYWLPAALVGKGWGAEAANTFLLLWSYAGVLLVLYYLNRLFSFRYALIVSLLFMGWSGLDVLGRLIMQPLASFTTFQLEAYYLYSYTAFTSNLYNVFNQAIPTWLITLWVFNNPTRLNLLPIAFLLAYAPFAFAGLALLYYTYYGLNRLAEERTVAHVITGILAEFRQVENIVAVVCLLVPYVLFYSAHTSSVPSALFWSRNLAGTRREKLQVIVFYFVTFFLEAGVYLLSIVLLSKKVYQANKRLFWLCLVMLLVLPFWIVGTGNDFASRSSMPFLVMLGVMTTKALLDGIENQVPISRFAIPLLALLIAWVTPAVAVINGIALRNPPHIRNIIGTFSNPSVSQANNIDGTYPSLVNYYAHEPKQHFFYKYLTKK